MLYIIIILIIIVLFVCFITNSDKTKFKNIDFKCKKLYLCVIFLHGNCNLKTNKAVLSRNNDDFLIETEDKNLNVESFKFNKSDIDNIEIKENLSSKSKSQLWNNFTTGVTMGSNTTFTPVKTNKFIKIYNINISLKK